MNEATVCSDSVSISVLSTGEFDLQSKEHPIVDQVPHLGDFQPFEYGVFDREGNDHGFLGTLSFGISSTINWPGNLLYLLVFSHIDVHEVFPS